MRVVKNGQYLFMRLLHFSGNFGNFKILSKNIILINIYKHGRSRKEIQ